ncbi:acyl-CoA N-acyltransferase [Fennellomyces sp. T-0311]|nr:acyl-CoA N-acyltransferase [Fennellomyces sp. T-0311]
MTSGRISLGDVTPNNVGQLRKLNQVIFPVNYGEKFYQDVLEVGELAKLVYFNDVCVGAVCCRKETKDGETRLYMMTLGVLKPYRQLGLGRQLLEHILEHASPYSSIYLHVQITNESALNFYKKHGFEVVGTEKDYYKHIEPRDAYILRKSL